MHIYRNLSLSGRCWLSLVLFTIVWGWAGVAQAGGQTCGAAAALISEPRDAEFVRQLLCDELPDQRTSEVEHDVDSAAAATPADGDERGAEASSPPGQVEGPREPLPRLDTLVRALMSEGQWGSALARDILTKTSAAPGPQALPSAACQDSLGKFVERKFEPLEQSIDNVPDFIPSDLDTLEDCNPLTASQRETLDSGSGYLLAVFLQPDDEAALIVEQRAGYQLIQPTVLDQHAGGRVWLFVRPASLDATVVVQQSDAATPWTLELSRNRNTALRWRALTCVPLTMYLGANEKSRLVLLDGQLINDQLQWTREAANSFRASNAIVIPVSAGREPSKLAVVVSPEMSLSWSEDVTFEPPAPGAEPSHCMQGVTRDLRSRYSLARVSVSETCANQTVLPTQIRAYVQQFASIRQISLAQNLDTSALVDAIEQLEQIGSTKKVALADTELDLARYAEAYLHQGITKLLTVDVHCAEAGGSLQLVARTLDITEEFAARLRHGATKVDMAGILRPKAVSVPDRHRLKDGLEEALGVILDRPAVKLTPPADVVDSSVELPLKYSWVGAAPDTKIEVGLAYFHNEFTANRVCDELDATASLSTIQHDVVSQALDEIGAQTDPGTMLVFHRKGQLRDPGVRPPVLLPIGRVGRYVTWVKEEDGPSFSAACFVIERRDWMLSAQLGGMVMNRRPSGEGFVRETSGIYEARERVSYYDLTVRATHTFGKFEVGQIGPVLGYSYTDYVWREACEDGDNDGVCDLNKQTIEKAETDENFDIDPASLITVEQSAGDLGASGFKRANWRRRGITLGGVIGVELPLNQCYWPRRGHAVDLAYHVKYTKSCQRQYPRAWSLGWMTTIAVNFGWHDDIKEAAVAFNTTNSRTLDLDAQISSQLLLRAQISPTVSFYMFYEFGVYDFNAEIFRQDGVGPGHPRYDFMLKQHVGVGVSVSLRVYAPRS